MFDGKCKIISVEDKPYGWVFTYQSTEYDQNDPSTLLVGNAPVIFDRINGDIVVVNSVTGIEAYEASIPEARLLSKPEESTFSG